MRIFKFPLNTDPFTMPKDAYILGIRVQRGVPTLWALCDPDAAPKERTISCYGTGQDIGPDPGVYIGTIESSHGLVWHYFDKGTPHA